MRLYYDRLIECMRIEVADLERSKLFYKAVLWELERDLTYEDDSCFAADELLVTASGDEPSHVHFLLRAKDRETVERFHAAGIAAGGQGCGPPGERNPQLGHYAAYVLDPDGNAIEVACYEVLRQERARSTSEEPRATQA